MAQGTLQNAWTRYIQEGRQWREDSQKQVEAFAKRLVQEGELRQEQVQAAVDDIRKRSMTAIKNLEKRIRSETKVEIGRLGVATRSDIEKLEKRVAKVEKSVADQKKAAPRSGTSRASTAKSTASKSASSRTSSTTRRTAAKRTGSTTPES